MTAATRPGDVTIIHDLPEKDYRALPGLSGTEVAKILDNPADLKWDREHPRQSTDAQSLGTLVHALVLGTDPHVTIAPFANFRSKDAQNFKADAEAAGLNVITQATMDQALALRDAVMAHDLASELIKAPGHSEVTLTDQHKGAPLKGRIDRLPKVGPIIDLKTARDVSVNGMSRFIGEFGTTTQLAHYAMLSGRENDRPYIVAVRNNGRPAVRVYQIAEMTWHVALDATRRAWDTYADCIETGVWPDPYAEQIGDLELRAWDMDALDDIEEIEVA